MEVKLIRTILFRDPNGNDLRLTLGKIKDMEAYNRFRGFANNDDKGFRWQFVGKRIPGLHRSGEWFNGFPDDITIPWVKSQGYEVVATTSHVTGSVYVVKGNETPVTTAVNPDDDSKGNEPYKLTELAIRKGHEATDMACKLLCDNFEVLKAVELYRLVHKCGMREAKKAVQKICNP